MIEIVVINDYKMVINDYNGGDSAGDDYFW